VRAREGRTRLAARITVAVAFASTPALADVTKDQCVDANGKGQELRREGKLTVAREQLQTCANPSCPAMVRDDCTKRLNELEGAQPTIIFDPKDGSGHDLSTVTVTMDGHPFAEKLDGKALPVDPGEHEFTFTVADQAPVTDNVVIKEGEKERHERVVIGAPPVPTQSAPSAQASAGAPAMAPPAPTAHGLGARKVFGLTVGGAGVAGMAVGAVFGAMTFSETSKQKSDCASPATCPFHALALSDHSTATTDGTVSTVALIAGGALLVGGAVLFFAPIHSSDQPAPTALVVVPSAGPGRGFLSLSGAF
jgi:hypothetical protein